MEEKYYRINSAREYLLKFSFDDNNINVKIWNDDEENYKELEYDGTYYGTEDVNKFRETGCIDEELIHFCKVIDCSEFLTIQDEYDFDLIILTEDEFFDSLYDYKVMVIIECLLTTGITINFTKAFGFLNEDEDESEANKARNERKEFVDGVKNHFKVIKLLKNDDGNGWNNLLKDIDEANKAIDFFGELITEDAENGIYVSEIKKVSFIGYNHKETIE